MCNTCQACNYLAKRYAAGEENLRGNFKINDYCLIFGHDRGRFLCKFN